jgi:hypothetical protein
MVGMTHHSSTSASAKAEGSPMMSGAEPRPFSPDVPTLAASPSGLGPAGGLSSVMSLCLAVLAASLLLLLARRAQGLPVMGLAPGWLTAQRSTPRTRDRDPPSLSLLSVRRC